jgi:hypothetical protein
MNARVDKVETAIRTLASKRATDLSAKMNKRLVDMEADDNSHYLIYRVLGISLHEGQEIDKYQNKGRFLYNCAGGFLESAAKMCFSHKYPDARRLRIPNTAGNRPKTFEIDCVIKADAFEIKWRDATTDGDHIIKEHTRLKAVASAGYKPIRIMFYYPNREQAVRIQQTLETLYKGENGEYHYGRSAWGFVHSYTGVDLEGILRRIADEKVP